MIDENDRFVFMAEVLYDCALTLAKQNGTDRFTAMSALGFATTKMAFRLFDHDEDRLKAVKIICEAHNHAIGDMISGTETQHQVTQ